MIISPKHIIIEFSVHVSNCLVIETKRDSKIKKYIILF